MITNFAPWQWLLGIFSALAIGVHRVPQRLFDTMIVLLTGDLSVHPVPIVCGRRPPPDTVSDSGLYV
jgi:hypothetical protein